ncbi:hypothetical protein BKA62DRAFT_657857 [Auriculariales sp. MPI-PUGE-AT-0066]|nr:hypothetical protein BKA62DRAFT_657857 [Auriculariales sp. MPI-PUGE-AT-0066]
MPRGGVPGPSGVAPYPSGPLQSHPAAQYAGYPSGSPVSTGYHQPQFVSHPTPMPGGQFSILRTSHGAQPLSVASSSATYGGLSGNVRPLRQNEFSQYAVEQTTVDGRVEVRYRCQECGKGFDRPSSLKTHMTSHSGERPHACPFAGCGRRFGVSSNMHRHVRTAHGGGGGLGTLSGDEDGFGEDQDA